jgi:hypothetical protein
MVDKKMFATRIGNNLLKAPKHLSVDAEKPVAILLEESIKDLLEKYGSKTKE